MYKAVIYIAIILGIVITFLLLGNYVLTLAERFFPPNQPPPDKPTNLESYLKVAGIGLTLLASVMAALVTLVNTIIQVSLNREIEKLKPLLTLQYAAFKELNGAAIGVLDTLSRLQNGAYTDSLGAIASNKMTEASGTVLFMPKRYKEAWLAFQYEALRAREAADELYTALKQGNTSWRLIIKDAKDQVVIDKEVKSQQELWLLFQPKVYAAFEKLAEATPH